MINLSLHFNLWICFNRLSASQIKNTTVNSKSRLKHVTLLVLLDLSAAFDTVDHDILLARLKSSVSINGTALNSFTSYLSNRSQRVSLNGCISDSFRLPHGVPQGSCLGPLLFTIYSSKLFEVIKYHLPQAHAYADDTQLYLSFSPDSATNQADAVVAMERCILDIRTWMLTDKLKLNDDKTEFMLIGTKQQLSKVNIDSLTVGNIDVAPVTVARNLGTWFDSNQNLQEQIHKTCKSGFFYLHNIRRIRKYLSQESARTLVHALIMGRIDYCNSLLFGLPSVHLLKLQRLQNAAARLISNVPRYSHITPVLCSLHWLPVKFRIDFKILLLTFKAIYGHAPGYLTDLIAIKVQTRYTLRSASGLTLNYPSVKLKKTLGDRAFSSAAPTLWNSLPLHIRLVDNFERFKSVLKTHLFKLAFDM